MPVNEKHKGLNLNTENALAPNPYNHKQVDEKILGGRLSLKKEFSEMRLSHEVVSHKQPLVADLINAKP
jgi:hypothetical protein